MNHAILENEVKQWHLIQFKPNAYRLAVKNLRQQGFGTFLPMQEVTRRKSSRFVSELRPLFPGYMFVSVDGGAAPWRAINSTMGVSRLVSFGEAPKPLPENLISSLMLRCDAQGKLMPVKTLSAGDSVEVLRGPFAKLVATIEKIDAQQRVWVLMDLMGQSARVQVTPDQVQIVN